MRQYCNAYSQAWTLANKTKVAPDEWLEEARRALVDYGAAGVKVDRLAKSLNVTRGGFYYHFKNQQDLMTRLVEHWVKTNEMIPDRPDPSSPKEALHALHEIAERLALQEEFCPAFDLAMREWARFDEEVGKTVDKIDTARLAKLRILFSALGCDEDETGVRAIAFYCHHIGYYAVGRHELDTRKERLRWAPVYLSILCGAQYVAAAEQSAHKRM